MTGTRVEWLGRPPRPLRVYRAIGLWWWHCRTCQSFSNACPDHSTALSGAFVHIARPVHLDDLVWHETPDPPDDLLWREVPNPQWRAHIPDVTHGADGHTYENPATGDYEARCLCGDVFSDSPEGLAWERAVIHIDRENRAHREAVWAALVAELRRQGRHKEAEIAQKTLVMS